MTPPSPPSSRLSASEFVADTLRREILRGDLLPGQALLQDHIAARFDVSQSSVREAMRRLEALALVTSIRNRGTFVSTLTTAQVEEMYDIRLAVELFGLRNNFGKLTPEQLATAGSLIESMEKEPETAFFMGEAHKKFHSIFYSSPERTLSNDILQNIYGNLTRLWVDFIRKKPSQARRYEEESGSEHRELLDAIKSGNLTKAETVLGRHVNRARELLTSHLRQIEASAAAQGDAAPAATNRPKAATAEPSGQRRRATRPRA